MARMPTFQRREIEPRFFPQHEIEPAKVRRYAQRLKNGEEPPPAIVARYGDEVMPIDGHHRLSAARESGRLCDVWECDGEALEDYCIALGSAEADRRILARYGACKKGPHDDNAVA